MINLSKFHSFDEQTVHNTSNDWALADLSDSSINEKGENKPNPQIKYRCSLYLAAFRVRIIYQIEQHAVPIRPGNF